jgi:hypothetical protein
MLTDEVVDLLNERDTLRARVAELEAGQANWEATCNEAYALHAQDLADARDRAQARAHELAAVVERVRDVLTIKYEAAYDLAADIRAALTPPGDGGG